MKNLIFILVALLSLGPSYGQKRLRKPLYSREISMDVDNDIFFFIDYYYTAGQNLTYRRLADPKTALYRRFHAGASDSSKVIIALSAGFEIFTPRNIDTGDPKMMDRPYAGWSYVRAGITNFKTPSIGNRYALETGVVGRSSGMQDLQRWVHERLDFEVPKGWSSQIRDEVVLNLYYTRYHELELARNLDVVSQSAVQAGTGGNKVSQDFTFRTIHFNAIENSSFTQSRVSWNDRSKSRFYKKEVFLFFGAGVDYVLSNIFIQGSLFRENKSLYTVQMIPVIVRETFGIMFASRSVTWNITTVHLSKEVRAGIGHQYASLGMAVRF